LTLHFIKIEGFSPVCVHQLNRSAFRPYDGQTGSNRITSGLPTTLPLNTIQIDEIGGTHYAASQREGRIQSAERAVPTH
jgi:hypothetical protein